MASESIDCSFGIMDDVLKLISKYVALRVWVSGCLSYVFR